MKRLFQKYRGDILGLAWLAGAAFLACALWSYSPSDPSLSSLVQSVGKPRNWCGYVGAFLSDLFYQGFGLAAWILVLGATRQSLFSFKTHPQRREKVQWWLDVALLVCVAGLIALYFNENKIFSGRIRVSGWIGYLLTKGLVTAINEVGVAIVFWSLLAVITVLYTDRTWGELTERPRDGVAQFFAYLATVWTSWMRQLRAPSAIKTQRKLDEVKITRHEELRSPRMESAETAGKGVAVTVQGPTIDPVQGDLFAPITGFLTEQEKEEVRPRKIKVRIPRRVANWELPKLSMLEDPPSSRTRLDEREIKSKARLLAEKLAQFSVRGDVVGIKPGPAVTMFEFKPAVDVKISKITDLADDLSLALSSESVRIIAPIPGRDVVGIETSNSQRESVYAKDIIAQETFWSDDCKLPIPLGRKADGEPKVVDLRKMPHLLVAGTTGSGKSVFIVSMITGLLFRHSPKTLKLILVDPKQVDLAAFNEVPHLVMPPIREAKKAVGALRWAIREMEKRYRSMSKFGARNLESFNEVAEALTAEQVQQHNQAHETLEGSYHPESYYFQQLPYIVIVVEEFGDLMVVDKVNVEQSVVRLAQMARACGIHLVLAMQSPRKDVVTGLIKTNIPGRISFKVASKMDSRIILDEGGAERLLARGDMLFLAPTVSKPERHHGPFLSEKEINEVVGWWRNQGEPEYDAVAMKAIEGTGGGFDVDPGGGSSGDGDGGDFDDYNDGDIRDDRYDEVLAWVASQREVSASLLQRRFRLGYPRAARMIEIFEAERVVGPANGSKPRQVLIREMPK
jgi:S-DNA-T family DNA segregation ATPase FtsK/SpoIIIE